MKYLLIIITLFSTSVFGQENAEQKNRARFVLGSAPNGFTAKQNSSSVRVAPNREEVMGLGYERKVNHDLSIGFEILSNGTFLGTASVDF